MTFPFPGGLLGVLAALTLLAAAAPARAQSGTLTTPDGKQVLVSKDVGAERWAIALNLNDATVTGNVFRQEGEPQFVWCERLGEPLGDPSTTEIQLSCRGADRCASSPCLATSWTELGQVSLPGSFFLPATDPFSPLRGPDHFCDPLGHGFEELGGEQTYGIESGFCNFVTAMQPSMTAIEAGEEILIRLWHFALTAPDPGEAYLAIQVGDQMLWEARLPIPCIAGLVGARPDDCPENPIPGSVDPVIFAAPFSVPAGAPVYFHVQNHGQNGYNLIEVAVGGGRPLVSATAWTVVSKGLPLFPPFINGG